MSETPEEIIDQLLIDTHEFVERALAVEAERDRLREALERIKAMVLIHSSEARDVFLVAEEALAAKEPRDE